ncbi:Coatomer beta subunit [Spironucleus salmonicida]|uniref:Coatomer beta subunit n=1 Tax=Spironucleus salmonicida TaxID=348837 RepID=V6LV94_9EUKA|nr:Coatomer beta subunit [Spironucleus salmonicida]|eukprot:EST44704.1 Coatomer beta' subunit [Spironucleus salmonicida]
MQTTSTLRSSRVKAISFSENAMKAVIGQYTGEVQLFDLKTQQVTLKREISPTPIRTVFYAAPYIFTGSDDGILRVLSDSSLSTLQELQISTDYIRSIIYSAPHIFTATDDGFLRVFRFTAAIELIAEARASSGFLLGLALANGRLATCGQGGEIRVFDATNIEIDPKNDECNPTHHSDNVIDIAHKLAKGLLGRSSAQNRPCRQLTPLFTISCGVCLNALCWTNCPTISGAETPLAFLAAATDNGEVLVFDSFNKQQIAIFGPFSGPVTQIAYCRAQQRLLATSEDFSVQIFDMARLERAMVLQYALERAWCVSAIQIGAATVIAIGFDQGAVFAKIGESRPVFDFFEGKFAFLGKFESGKFSVQEGSGISILNSKNEAKTFETEPFRSVKMLGNGKLFCGIRSGKAVICSAQTGKMKLEESCSQIAFARDFDAANFVQKLDDFVFPSFGAEQYYVILYNNKITVKNSTETICTIQVDFVPTMLFSGPYVFVANAQFLAIFTFAGAFIAQFELAVKSLQCAPSGEFCAILTAETTFLARLDPRALEISIFSEIPAAQKVLFGAKTVVFQSQNGVFQGFLEEILEGDELFLELPRSENLELLEILEVRPRGVLCVAGAKIGNQFELMEIPLDSAIVEFRLRCAAGDQGAEDAAAYCCEAFGADLGRVFICAEFLKRSGKSRYIMSLSDDNEVLAQLAVRYAFYEQILGVAEGLGSAPVVLAGAELLLRSGRVRDALALYRVAGDDEMALLCAFVLGDADAIRGYERDARPNIALAARCVLGSAPEALAELVELPWERAALGGADDVASWKAGCNRGEYME